MSKTVSSTAQEIVSRAVTSSLSAAKRQIFGAALNKQQVALVSDGEIKSRTTWVLLITAFIDLSGAVLLVGGAPMMCSNAPGSVAPGAPGAFPASDFKAVDPDFDSKSGPPALDYSLAINLITVANQFGGCFSNYLAGVASDKFGRKIVIQGCLLGGVVSYIIMFIAGFWVVNYWLFLVGNFVNGLFSGIRGVVGAYLQDIHDPKEFQTKVMPTMINFFLFGAMGGSIIGMVWVAIADSVGGDPAFTLFGPALVGVALSTGATLMVQVYCPEPARKEANTAAGGDAEAEKPPPMSRTARIVITIIFVAGSLDTFGDFGNKFARNTVLTNRYWQARMPVVNYVLMSSNVVSVYIAQKILVRTIKKLSMKQGPTGFMSATAFWMVWGNVASAVVQFALMVIIKYDDDRAAIFPYICVWLLSQIFGITSTFAAFFLFPAFVPAHRKGEFNGLRNSFTNLVNVLAPFMLAFIYQLGSMAKPPDAARLDEASIICLGICGGVSTLAFVCYVPLGRYLPKPPPPKPTEDEKVKDGAVAPEPEPLKPLEYYDHVKWEEWSEMPIKRRMEVQQARIAVGMPSVQLSWGTWEADVALAPEILAKAPRELGELREVCTEWVVDDAKLDKMLELRAKCGWNASEEGKAKRDKARADMGKWIADYLDDAGYDNWENVPYIYKAMVMNAFPPIDALDMKRASLTTRCEMRTGTLAFMKVLDLHIKTAETTAYNNLTDGTQMSTDLGKVKCA